MGVFTNLLKWSMAPSSAPPVRPGVLPDACNLDVREAYRLWAPTYAAETAISALDDELAAAMLRGRACTALLDAGCGIGRRIPNIPGAVGIDLSPEMLAAGGASNVVAGDVRELPFAGDRFDMIWCRLVLGHIPDPERAYREFARVCAPGGTVFVTDFHPAAAAAGHRRTLTDSAGTTQAIEHYIHEHHAEMAAAAGLRLIDYREGRVGPSVRGFYRKGLGLRAYYRDRGLRLVAAHLFHKPSVPPAGLYPPVAA